MLAKFCSRSQGQPVPGVRSAAMISIRWAISREACIAPISCFRAPLPIMQVPPSDCHGYRLNLGWSRAYTVSNKLVSREDAMRTIYMPRSLGLLAFLGLLPCAQPASADMVRIYQTNSGG